MLGTDHANKPQDSSQGIREDIFIHLSNVVIYSTYSKMSLRMHKALEVNREQMTVFLSRNLQYIKEEKQ